MSDLSRMFQKYKDGPIAIYGLGTETEKALKEMDGEFQIICLLDSYRESGTQYGKPIISVRQAIEFQVKLILVVARPGSCKAIAKKIGGLCKNNQIALIDVRGKDLSDIKKPTFCFRGKEGITKRQFTELIKSHDVISVDLFDTLVMRQTLFPTDIFEIMDCRLKEKNIYIEDFCGKRLESEKYLSRYAAPTLTAIYEYMKDTYLMPDMVPDEMAGMEWEIDYGLLVPRQEMCGLIGKAFDMGKAVYIVSDTYYDRGQLIKILEKCNITFYTDIFASCEYNTGKTQRLFGKLKEKICHKSCVHIGDDMVADIESAERNRITACYIHSGAELFEKTGYMGAWDDFKGLADRVKAGMFAARLFNSPFRFEEGEERISVRNAYDIGYLFFAPMISDFIIWLEGQIRHHKIQNVWFCARDGYLIKKLFDVLGKDVTSLYFMTSRIAAIRAGMENEEDIQYVAGMKFSGSLQEQLEERFGLEREISAEGSSWNTLLDYRQEILSNAAGNRRNYQKYISGLPVKEGEIAFFDFVAKGTSQMYIGRMLENHLKGFYFLQLERDYMREKNLDIQPFYQAEETEHSAVFDDYYILETMLTAPMPSVVGFDENGEACYAKETRKEEDIECFLNAQSGISDCFQTYLSLCPVAERRINKKLDEKFLEMIHHIAILDRQFLGLKVEDPFFHRNTDVADLI